MWIVQLCLILSTGAAGNVEQVWCKLHSGLFGLPLTFAAFCLTQTAFSFTIVAIVWLSVLCR